MSTTVFKRNRIGTIIPRRKETEAWTQAGVTPASEALVRDVWSPESGRDGKSAPGMAWCKLVLNKGGRVGTCKFESNQGRNNPVEIELLLGWSPLGTESQGIALSSS